MQNLSVFFVEGRHNKILSFLQVAQAVGPSSNYPTICLSCLVAIMTVIVSQAFPSKEFFFLESLYQFVVIAWICFLCLPSKQKMLYKQNPWNVERFLTYYNTYEECSYIKREVLQTQKTQCEKEVSCCSKWNHCDCGNIRTD